MRCLKRRISDAIYRQLLADARRPSRHGPGRALRGVLTSSAADLPPHIDTSDQPLPGPAKPTLQPTSHRRKTTKLERSHRLFDNRGEPERRTFADLLHGHPVYGSVPVPMLVALRLFVQPHLIARSGEGAHCARGPWHQARGWG